MKTMGSSLLLACLLLPVNIALAETLQIRIAQQGADLKDIMPMPKQGDSLTSVEAQWGEPLVRGSAVGSPPISKLSYPDFYVYFENDKVLHTVIKQ